MLEVNQVSKHYKKSGSAVAALNAVSLAVKQGDFLALRGASGSGKSTLLMTLGGMLKPTSGEVRFEGQSLYKSSNAALNDYRRLQIGFVFQLFHLVPYLSVVENVQVAAESKDRQNEAASLLKELGLQERLHHRPSELSAGEKQRTAIARALLNKPKLLLADEPTGNLDPENTLSTMELFNQFHRDGGTLILVSHDTFENANITRTVNLNKGSIVD